MADLLHSDYNSDPLPEVKLSFTREVIKMGKSMHPPLSLHRHPMCAKIIKEFQKCHIEHPYAKFFGECTDLKIKLDRCFRQEKAVKRKQILKRVKSWRGYKLTEKKPPKQSND
ncbi:hypothetical protein C5167_011917 [Papaver somniferum]|uniref:COX assembly mitochondrial protein n=1 Tax=Papaver somniferum TaxID=3469 RepID=A0A4Y7IVZ3_PAPSO|nr:hypothetical protein C5167_011917 [Papaver somniferum]